MVRTYGRWLAVLVLGAISVLSIARSALAAPAQTPEEIADACAAEIIHLDSEGLNAMLVERIGYENQVAQLPSNTPISQLFKMAAPVSVRLDKIGSTTRARIDKAANRCAARIQRLGGDPSLINEIAAQSEGLISEFDIFLIGRQYEVATVIGAFIDVQPAMSTAGLAMAAAPLAADEVAEACIIEMDLIDTEMTHAVGVEALNLAGAVNELPAGTPISQVFKAAAAVSGRIDKIGVKAALRVEKSWIKCGARIARLNGDGSLYKDIAVAHDQVIASISLNVNYRQGHVAGVVTDYILAQ